MNQKLEKISIGQINIFLTAAELESFTNTAASLHMTQSAVSKNIAKLEEELDLQLFIRKNREISLTEAGRILSEKWKKSLPYLTSAYEEVWNIQHRQEHKLRMGFAVNTDLEKYFWPVWQKFENQFPQVRADCSVAEMGILMTELAAGQLDLVFVPEFMQLKAERLGMNWKWAAKDYARVLLPKGHPLEKRRLTIELLQNEKFVHLSSSISDYYEYYSQTFREKGCQFLCGKDYNSVETVSRFYDPQDGIMLTDSFFDLHKIRGKTVRKTLKEIEAGIICVWVPERMGNYLKSFLDIIT